MGLPHTVHIGWCPVCGMGVTLDAPEDLGSLYSSEYRGEEGRVPATGRLAHAWHVFNGSLPLTDIVRTGPVLDVGSNTGEALVALRRRGFEVTGLEPNPEAAEVARGYGIEVISAPIEEAELPEGRFGRSCSRRCWSTSVIHTMCCARSGRRCARTNGVHRRPERIQPVAAGVRPRLAALARAVPPLPFHRGGPPQAVRAVRARARADEQRTPGEWLLLSLEARRNRRRGRYELEQWTGRYGRRRSSPRPDGSRTSSTAETPSWLRR